MKKTFGQIAFEAATDARPDLKGRIEKWADAHKAVHESWEAAALAVLAEPLATLKRLLGATLAFDFSELYDARADAQELLESFTPPETIDPYAELKAAHAAGKVIQIWVEGNPSGHWADLTPPFGFKASRDQYRIKPWTLPHHLPGFRPLEPGEEWHRQDFTEETLPEGWRPLLLGEPREIGDEHPSGDNPPDHTGWFAATYYPAGQNNAFRTWSHTRTRRPLPPTQAELEIAEFDAWFDAQQITKDPFMRPYGFQVWQAARKQKEAK